MPELKEQGIISSIFYMYTANKLVFYDTTAYEFKAAKTFLSQLLSVMQE